MARRRRYARIGRVFDTLAGYYTSCHSLSARDVGRVRADEASQAGDASMVATCRKALRGNVFARACCAGAIDTVALPRVGGQRA